MKKKSLNFYFLFIVLILLITSIHELSISVQASNQSTNNSSINNTFYIPRFNASLSPGNNIVWEFHGAYPNADNNTTIASFIKTYGINGWSHDVSPNGDSRYEYVYLRPEKNCSKNLVFIYYTPDDTRLNNSVVWVNLINKNETLPTITGSISATPNITPMNTTPGFLVVTTIVSIICISFITIYLKRK